MVHEQELLSCSFCGKPQKEVRKLIAGAGKLDDGRTLCICDECVAMCVEIVDEDLSRK